jgi:hypothetical protein
MCRSVDASAWAASVAQFGFKSGIFSDSRCFLAMEHRGIQYQVEETASPTGWKWTVQLADGRTRTGVSFSRGHAIFYAINAIDLALSEPPKAE